MYTLVCDDIYWNDLFNLLSKDKNLSPKYEIKNEVKNSFSVGDIVGIDHKKIPSSVDFRITKINNKNIKVQGVDDLFSVYTVSPGLLVRR